MIAHSPAPTPRSFARFEAAHNGTRFRFAIHEDGRCFYEVRQHRYGSRNTLTLKGHCAHSLAGKLAWDLSVMRDPKDHAFIRFFLSDYPWVMEDWNAIVAFEATVIETRARYA